MAVLVHVVVCELHFVERNVVLHPVTSCGRTVRVEIESENISVKIENISVELLTLLEVVALLCLRLSTPCLSTCICSPPPARCPSGRSSAGWPPDPPPSPSLWGTFAWKRDRCKGENNSRERRKGRGVVQLE